MAGGLRRLAQIKSTIPATGRRLRPYAVADLFFFDKAQHLIRASGVHHLKRISVNSRELEYPLPLDSYL